ncbi:hypothetical protein Poli38472_011278 [Pythium oligandrum]|uniref:C2 domain-containing protein n=1 Tax=Pythium oligandrum TaxID=41045 RepID=A0A8K1CST5_PYTOL|nr:hypothetical protein Poli38472_011278 [Pythium oligandrum]|eukprot:TMW67658.1 hypothetical protein Poli38472_011278 [Pythium oligandrum]
MRSSLASSMSTMSLGRSSIAGHGGVLRNDSVLYITVLGARELKDTQKIGVQDPFCAVYLMSGGQEGSSPAFKTSTHDNGGVNPVWNEKSTIIIPDVASDVLKVKIMNENWVGSNTIGEVAIPMRDLSRGRSMEKEFALTPKGFVRVLLYLALAHENPTTQPRVQMGEYPQHFIPGKSKLFLSLVTGDKLRDIQAFGTQDPYCQVYVTKNRRYPPAEDMVYKTKTHDNGGKNPRWMEAMTAGLRCIEHDFLIIRVMNDNHLKDELIGEVCFKLELLIGRGFEDKMLPLEAENTIVGQIRVQLALFNDEVMEEDDEDIHAYASDLDGCTCSIKSVQRATKVGDVIINGIAPDGVHYLEAGSVVATGCTIAGDYVMDKDCWDGDEF